MDRREFLKTAAAGAAVASVSACTNGSINDGGDAAPVSGEMEMRTNPLNGDKVSLLGYGCMRWPMDKDEDGNDFVEQDTVNELVDRAIEMGVNYFDTAPFYMQALSEKAAAAALARHPRGSYFLATKMSNFRDRSFEGSVAIYRNSLEVFNTDYIDYYLLHALRDEKSFKERFIDNGVIDFLLSEKEKGHIRNLGFSFHGTPEGFDSLMRLHDKYHWDFVQIQMNYVDWKSKLNAEHLYSALAERGIPVIIMEPLLGGRLADVPEHVALKYKEQEPLMSIASWAFRFCASFPNVLTVLSGMTYSEHLEDNLRSFCGFRPLTDAQMKFVLGMGDIIRSFPTIPCTGCQYCMPCPYGIAIPDIFAHHNRAIAEGFAIAEPLAGVGTAGKDGTDVGLGTAAGVGAAGKVGTGVGLGAAGKVGTGVGLGAGVEGAGGVSAHDAAVFRKARRKYLANYDRLIEPDRQADHCIRCGACRDRCPQKIDIPSFMKDISAHTDKLKNTL